MKNLKIKEKKTIAENFLVFNISYKTLMGTKPMRIRFNKIGGSISVYAGTIYLVLFGAEK